MLIVILGLWIWAAVVCIQKGKPGMVLAGLLLTPITFVGACRVAKPNSSWALKNYPPDSANYQLAHFRHPVAR